MPGLGKEANTTFSGEKLALTYGGSAMPGKQIKFHTYDGEKASIEMSGVLDLAALFPSENLPEIGLLAPGVVPGEIITQLENVPLTLGADGSTYSFSGTDTASRLSDQDTSPSLYTHSPSPSRPEHHPETAVPGQGLLPPTEAAKPRMSKSSSYCIS